MPGANRRRHPVAITLSTYSHWFAKRADSRLGTRL